MKRSRASTRVPGADVFFFFFRLGFRCSFVWRGGAADRRAFGWSLASALQHAFRGLMFLSSFFDWVLSFFRDFDVLSSGAGARLIGGVFGGIISFFAVFRTSC